MMGKRRCPAARGMCIHVVYGDMMDDEGGLLATERL